MSKDKSEAQLCMEDFLTDLFGDRWVSELQFAPPRRWKFDYAVPSMSIAIEIEGGIWSGGRHTRGKGFQGDLDKYNTATKLGWRVFRFSTQDVLVRKQAAFMCMEASSALS